MDPRTILTNVSCFFNSTNFGVNGLDELSAEELLKVYQVATKCEFDFYCDQWTFWQVQAAVMGAVPQFNDETEEPVFNEKTGIALRARVLSMNPESEWKDRIKEFLQTQWDR